ncbi:MAG: Ig-like domain-containing protein [Acidobacteriota bacterium]|nr:Ig-like domain-containing protein [Acidobacteriota bacterium]
MLDATATVTSSKPLTGTITFWETGNNGALTPPLLLSNGTARTQLNFGLPGIHQVHAEYSGDAQNQKSQSATVTIVATGTSYVQVTGTTGPLTHYGSVDVTIQ